VCSAKQTNLCTAKTWVLIFVSGFRPVKSRERDIRKKCYIPCQFDGLDQLQCGIGNYLFIKWRPGIINSKLNVVRAYLIPNSIPVTQNSGKTHQLKYIYKYIYTCIRLIMDQVEFWPLVHFSLYEKREHLYICTYIRPKNLY